MLRWLLAPIEYAYFNGPSRLGLWNGVAHADACSELTRVPSSVWVQQQAACDELLHRDFRAFLIGCSLIGSAVVAWKALDACVWSCALRRLQRAVLRTGEGDGARAQRA